MRIIILLVVIVAVVFAVMSSGDIAYKYGVSERTASNWRNKAKAEVQS